MDMGSALRFQGLAGRAAYVCGSLAVFFSQHLAMLAALFARGGKIPSLPWWFWFNPFRYLLFSASNSAGGESFVLPLGMVATLAADAALVWLAFRRARRLKDGGWAASFTLVPLLQLAAMAWLTLAPDTKTAPQAGATRQARLDARTVVLGVLVGVGLIVGTVALSALVFGLYGYTLFLTAPFLIATVIGFLANRQGKVGYGRTFGLVFIAFIVGGATLVGFAFEGVVCLLMATPLIAAMGVMGAALGASLAGLGRRGRGTTLTSVALIPVLLAAEAVLPPRAAFESVESTLVAAPPSAVWDAVVHMGPIPDAPAAPFRWGLAYPLRGEIMGKGVGSIRRGVFSTGVAYERVTEWEPGKRLSFIVLSDPPSIHELSPYDHVNSPHVKGYFRTVDARFVLTPLPDGRTRLTLSTRHELNLEPALYWTPMAQWAVHANKARVLAHFRQQAEAAGVTPLPSWERQGPASHSGVGG